MGGAQVCVQRSEDELLNGIMGDISEAMIQFGFQLRQRFSTGVEGIALDTVGIILMVAGAVGFLLTMLPRRSGSLRIPDGGYVALYEGLYGERPFAGRRRRMRPSGESVRR